MSQEEIEVVVSLDCQEVNTVLAALRHYHDTDQGEPSERTDEVHDLATDEDREISLDAVAIDQLFGKIKSLKEKLDLSLESPGPFQPKPTAKKL